MLFGDWKCSVVVADLHGSTGNVTAFLATDKVPPNIQCLQAFSLQPAQHGPARTQASAVTLFTADGFAGAGISIPTVEAPLLYRSPIAALLDVSPKHVEGRGQGKNDRAGGAKTNLLKRLLNQPLFEDVVHTLPPFAHGNFKHLPERPTQCMQASVECARM